MGDAPELSRHLMDDRFVRLNGRLQNQRGPEVYSLVNGSQLNDLHVFCGTSRVVRPGRIRSRTASSSEAVFHTGDVSISLSMSQGCCAASFADEHDVVRIPPRRKGPAGVDIGGRIDAFGEHLAWSLS